MLFLATGLERTCACPQVFPSDDSNYVCLSPRQGRGIGVGSNTGSPYRHTSSPISLSCRTLLPCGLPLQPTPRGVHRLRPCVSLCLIHPRHSCLNPFAALGLLGPLGTMLMLILSQHPWRSIMRGFCYPHTEEASCQTPIPGAPQWTLHWAKPPGCPPAHRGD